MCRVFISRLPRLRGMPVFTCLSYYQHRLLTMAWLNIWPFLYLRRQPIIQHAMLTKKTRIGTQHSHVINWTTINPVSTLDHPSLTGSNLLVRSLHLCIPQNLPQARNNRSIDRDSSKKIITPRSWYLHLSLSPETLYLFWPDSLFIHRDHAERLWCFKVDEPRVDQFNGATWDEMHFIWGDVSWWRDKR